jgi:hypothetical protein
MREHRSTPHDVVIPRRHAHYTELPCSGADER